MKKLCCKYAPLTLKALNVRGNVAERSKKQKMRRKIEKNHILFALV
jgi:hypothetical protein